MNRHVPTVTFDSFKPLPIKYTLTADQEDEEAMSSIAISSIVFACVFGGAMCGMALRATLPERQLSSESKDAVKLGMGLVATMAALVLGLLVASAKGAYDTQSTELTGISANIVVLDRVLAHYGPETKEARDLLRDTVVRFIDVMWFQNRASRSQAGPGNAGGEILFDKIQGLSPKNDSQRSLQAQALSIALSMGQTRWLMYVQGTTSISTPLLIVVVFWLTALFTSFGLFAPRNTIVIASMFVSALSVSAAILIILELYNPYGGLIQISSAPLRAALGHLGN
jgi:hypothetical protein